MHDPHIAVIYANFVSGGSLMSASIGVSSLRSCIENLFSMFYRHIRLGWDGLKRGVP